MKAIGIFFPRFYKWVPTTIGHVTYLPANWDSFSDSIKFIIIEHEKIHSSQQVKYSPLLYHFLNLFVFPVLYSPFRLYWEKDAWEKTILSISEYLGPDFKNDEGFMWFISQVDLFFSYKGGWMWPNKKAVYKWLNNIIDSCYAKNDIK